MFLLVLLSFAFAGVLLDELTTPGAATYSYRNTQNDSFTFEFVDSVYSESSWELPVADFNGDGFPDSFTGYGEKGVALLGRGDLFYDVVPAPANISGKFDMAVADFDGDGDLDVFMSPYTGTAAIGLNLGNGSFDVLRVDQFASARSASTGDFDADHIPDLALCIANGTVLLIRNTGGAVFTVHHVYHELDCTSVFLRDVNSDGHVDVIVSSKEIGSLVIFLGDGSGAFAATPDREVSYRYQFSVLIVVDMNNDKVMDLVVGASSIVATIFFGGDNATFTAGYQFALGDNSASAFIDVGDVNNDGLIDAVTTRQLDSACYFEVHIRQANGSFATQQDPTWFYRNFANCPGVALIPARSPVCSGVVGPQVILGKEVLCPVCPYGEYFNSKGFCEPCKGTISADQLTCTTESSSTANVEPPSAAGMLSSFIF